MLHRMYKTFLNNRFILKLIQHVYYNAAVCTPELDLEIRALEGVHNPVLVVTGTNVFGKIGVK